jgi:hypothetical protein
MTGMNFISRHAIGVLVVLVIAGWALFYVPTTPSYAIYQLKQAIDERDGATAATFVDFPSVVKNAGYDMLQHNSQANDVITALVGKGAVDMLSAPLAAGVQQWATQQVNSGARQVQMPHGARERPLANHRGQERPATPAALRAAKGARRSARGGAAGHGRSGHGRSGHGRSGGAAIQHGS